MYSLFSDSSINKLFYKILDASLEWPKGVIRREGKSTIDSPGPVCVELTNPHNKVLTIPGRAGCFPATCAETLWVLGGRNDLDFIKYYLPRAVDFSDDGKTWRAGYGPRLRGAYKGFPDQLSLAIQELSKDTTTRRSVITLFDPEKDYLALIDGTKDFPCTQSLSFMVRDGKLDLTVFIRSNDFIWGWSHINVFEFCCLQEIVSSITAIPLGSFYIVSNSLHIYEDLSKRISKISRQERFDIYDNIPSVSPKEASTLEDTNDMLELALVCLDMAREGKFEIKDWILQLWLATDLISDLTLSALFFTYAKTNLGDILGALDSMTDEAFKIAILEWLVRTDCVTTEMLAYLKTNMRESSISRYVLLETELLPN